MSVGEIKISRKLATIFDGEARYRCAYGGRGSGKTRTFAQMAAVWGYRVGMRGDTGKILILREFHNSVDDSSFEEIREAIRGIPWLEEYYSVGRKYVRSKDGQIEFRILGLRRSLNSIKSFSGAALAWIDEAEPISEVAWRKLIPTIRSIGSELWITWNPEAPDSPVSRRFLTSPPPDCKIAKVNWRDNPWFPKVLDSERQYDKDKYPELYDHIWEGAYLEYSDGAYYSKEIKQLQDAGRISMVDYDHNLKVTTAWDLGYNDSTAIWFAQKAGQEIRLIDYIEDNQRKISDYVLELQKRNYVYGKHILPSDAKQPQINTGKSVIDVLQNLGLQNIVIAPSLTVSEGRDAVRTILPHCWFDGGRCEKGIRALKNHQRRYNEASKTWGKAIHDWSSHGADAFRYLAVSGPDEEWGDDVKITFEDFVP